MTTQNLFTIINYISKFHLDPSLTHSPPRADPSICIVSSSSPEIFLRSSVSTRSTTRSARVYTVGPRLPCGPPTSCAEADTASWMWIEPTSAEASFGQNRAREYDARPSIEESCGERQSFMMYFRQTEHHLLRPAHAQCPLGGPIHRVRGFGPCPSRGG